MAAGCTLDEEHFDVFDQALQQVAREWLDAATLTRRLLTDGPLALEYFNAETVSKLDSQVWGQAFEAPVFYDEVQVLGQRLVAEKHLKLRVKHQGQNPRCDLVRPCRTGGRARAIGLSPVARRMAGAAAGADGGGGGGLMPTHQRTNAVTRSRRGLLRCETAPAGRRPWWRWPTRTRASCGLVMFTAEQEPREWQGASFRAWCRRSPRPEGLSLRRVFHQRRAGPAQ